MTFRVGQEVVCVDADGAPALTLNATYEVTRVNPPFLCVAGVFEEWAPNNGMRAHRFRPLVHDTTKAVEAIKASLPRLKQKVMT